MKGRNIFAMIFSMVLILLNFDSGLSVGHSIEDFSELFSLNDQHPDPAPWVSEVVDSSGDVGRHVSIAVDPGSGQTFISYFGRELGGSLNLARYVGSGGNCGLNNTWKCQILDSFDVVGEYNSIDTYPSEDGVRVIISYYDFTNGALKYVYGLAKSSNFNFSVYTIDSGKPKNGVYKGMHTSVKFDSKGVSHIAYQYYSDYANEAQLYAHWVGDGTGNCGEGAVAGDWQCDTIYNNEGVGMYASLDLDGNDHPSIAFYDENNGDPLVAQYLGPGGNCGPSNSWMCWRVGFLSLDTGKYISLYVEDNNQPHIAYYKAPVDPYDYGWMMYAEYVGEGGNCGVCPPGLGCRWQCDYIDEMGSSLTSMGIAIADDGTGNPIIAYQDASEDQAPAALKVARPVSVMPQNTVPNCGPVDPTRTWYCEMVDRGGANFDEAGSVSIALNPMGLAMIAYHELDKYAHPAKGNLKVAYQQPQLQVFFPLALNY